MADERYFKPYSNWNVNLGTVKKSRATMASRWFCKNVNQFLAR